MARETVLPRSAGVSFTWPVDEDGQPMTLITFQASELVGLPEYSNVTIGPASITKFVKSVDHETDEGRAELVEDLRSVAQAVEESVAEERAIVHAAIQGK